MLLQNYNYPSSLVYSKTVCIMLFSQAASEKVDMYFMKTVCECCCNISHFVCKQNPCLSSVLWKWEQKVYIKRAINSHSTHTDWGMSF